MTDPTPPPYTSAQFRTDRDALGLSVDFIASRLGLAPVTVWKYQAAGRDEPIPERVRELIAELDTIAEAAAQRLAEGRGAIRRPSDDAELDEHYPDLAGWGVHAFGLVAARAARIRSAERAERTPVEWIREGRA